MKIRIIGLVICFVFPWTAAASAETNQDKALCNFYGVVGQASVEYILPMRVQDLLNMLSGKDEKLMGKFTQKLLDTITGSELLVLADVPDGDVEWLGQSAGQIAIQSLMSARITSGAEVKELLYNHCIKTGVQQIIQKQKASAELLKVE